jgi:prepilin-type N-terminal cleavage/methylation domain-containing protein/prepilin-type processing-associated H-X9-DG protein
MSRRARGLSRGFTLVELLVVIGIIAVLVSILLPTLNKAREQAARIKCQANIRTIMLASLMYANENKAQLPFCNWDPNADSINMGSAGYGGGWLFSSATTATPGSPVLRKGYGGDIEGTWVGRAQFPPDGVMTGVVWPYIKQLGVYHCPMDIETASFVQLHWLTSYLSNGAECGYPNVSGSQPPIKLSGTPGLKTTQYRNNAHCAIYWEVTEGTAFDGVFANSGGDWKDGSSLPNQEVLTNRHYAGGNIAYLDGHVDWMDQYTFYNYAQLTTSLTNKTTWFGGPNDLWCCPLYTFGGPNAVDTKYNGGKNPTLVLGGATMGHAPGW